MSPESLGASSDHRSRGQADEHLCPILKEDHRPARRVGVPGEDRVGLLLPVPRKDGLQVAAQDDISLIPQWHDAGMLLEGHAWILRFLVASYGPNGLVRRPNGLVQAPNLPKGRG